MKKFLMRKYIYTILFLVTIFGFAGVNLMHSYEPLREILTGKDITVAAIDSAITENLYGRMKFIETYGFIQVLLDKRECNDFTYIKDEDGYLHYASFYREEDTRLFEYALRVKRLQDYVEQSGTRVLFVVPPGKYNKKYTEFRTGMPVNDPSYIVDEMMFYLNRMGVETLDLREHMPNEGMAFEDMFFKTDHHWTIPAAFNAAGILTDKFKESFDEDLDPDGFYMDISNYEIVTYHSGMLGSMGRKTGVNFCEVEDFTALWPKFSGQFTRESMMDAGYHEEQEGSFDEVLMSTNVLTRNSDIYSDSQYSLYLDGLRIYEKIVNEEKPDGCSIFFVRDSYFSPVMAFLAPMCGEIDAIWSLEETDELDIETYLKENTFDYVIIEIYPYNINSSAFNFFRE